MCILKGADGECTVNNNVAHVINVHPVIPTPPPEIGGRQNGIIMSKICEKITPLLLYSIYPWDLNSILDQ